MSLYVYIPFLLLLVFSSTSFSSTETATDDKDEALLIAYLKQRWKGDISDLLKELKLTEPSSDLPRDLPLLLEQRCQHNTDESLFYYVFNISMALVILAMAIVLGCNAADNVVGAPSFDTLSATAIVTSAVVIGIAGFEARHKLPGLSSL